VFGAVLKVRISHYTEDKHTQLAQCQRKPQKTVVTDSCTTVRAEGGRTQGKRKETDNQQQKWEYGGTFSL